MDLRNVGLDVDWVEMSPYVLRKAGNRLSA
jgi:hypothetical protein